MPMLCVQHADSGMHAIVSHAALQALASGSMHIAGCVGRQVCAGVSTWEKRVIVCHAKEEGQVIAYVAALRIHQYVPGKDPRGQHET